MTDFADRIHPNQTSIGSYLESLLKNQYQIPTFQREVVWQKDNVRKLWDSIYKFYPLGSILIWKTDLRLQSLRQIGGIKLPPDHTADQYHYILDGQQRSTSLLHSIYGGRVAGREEFDPSLYIDLTIELKDETDDESYRQRFVFWDEIDDRDGELLLNKGRQKRFNEGLIVSLRDVKERVGDVERRLHEAGYGDWDHPYRRHLRLIKSVLDTYRISIIELKGIQVSEVCQIFERINQEGKPLDIFDIVVAKTFRPETEDQPGFYLREIVNQFRNMIVKSDFSKIDERALLEILAVFINREDPEAGIRNITPRYLNLIRTEQIEQVWEHGQKAIMKTFDFLSSVLNIKGPGLVPYRYFYITLADYFYRNPEPDYPFLKKYFWYYSFHNEDLLQNTTQLRRSIRALRKKLDGKGFEFEPFVIDRESLRKATYSSKGRWSRAILSFLASQKPKDWAVPHRDVVADVYFILTDKPNLHHIFPTGFLEKNPGLSKVNANSLMNIAFLTQITNLEISAKNPLEYIRDYEADGFGEVLRDHLVPTELLGWVEQEALPKNALDRFIDQRVQLFIEELQKELDVIPFVVNDSAVESSSVGS